MKRLDESNALEKKDSSGLLKRINTTPNDDDLLELIAEDPIKRNDDLNDFAGILSHVDKGYTFFLDAAWGDGKTYFVRQLKLLLEFQNLQLEPAGNEEIDSLLAEGQSLSRFADLDSFLPVYYNAWENDYWDDPLPSIAVAIASAGYEKVDFRNDTNPKEKVASLLDVILTVCGQVNGASFLYEHWTGENLLKDFEERRQLRDEIANLVENVLPEQANRLLLIVDELDRCRPTFALRILEELKNLFELDNVVLLYSLNTSQLAHTIEGVYGAGFDGERYLSRFYDQKIVLRDIPPQAFLSYLGVKGVSNPDWAVITETIEAYNMPMREERQYLEVMQPAKEEADQQIGKRSVNNFPIKFAECVILPIVMAMKLMDPPAYRALCRDYETSALNEKILSINSAYRYLEEAANAIDAQISGDEERKAACERLTAGCAQLIWNTNRTSEAYLNARKDLYQDDLDGFGSNVSYIAELLR